MKKDKKVLILGVVWPEPNSSAAGSRMLQLIDVMLKNHYELIFASAAMPSEFMVDLVSMGVGVKEIKLNCSSFDDYIKVLQPKVVFFDRFMVEEQFGWRVAEYCPNAVRILDTEDLHCLRKARQKAFKNKSIFELEDLFSEEVAKREIASILRCDLSLIISKFEMKILTEQFKIDSSLLLYLPFMIEVLNQEEFRKLPSFEQRRDFVFIGNFLHEPNWNAVQYLKESIWPLIRKELPDVCINIYGAYPSEKVLQLNQPKEGFNICGRAAEAKAVIEKSRVLLAPIRFGAGLKGKLVEAMQYGTPSVTTAVGAEAMHDDLLWNGTIADEPVNIAASAVELYTSEAHWYTAQSNGIEILRSCYQKDKYEQEFIAALTYLFSQLEKHRTNNFMGNLLQHHTLKSTMYMAKWIEAKNK